MVKTSQLPAVDRTVPLEQISQFAERVSIFTDELRDTILAPRPRKAAPVFKTGEMIVAPGVDDKKNGLSK